MITQQGIELWLKRLYIAAEGAGLRVEDRRKALEVAAMLREIERGIDRFSRRSSLVLVDAAAGKSYVGLLAAKLLLDPGGRRASVITIEQDPKRVQASCQAVQRLESSTPIECRLGDVSSGEAWPKEMSIVTALHACGAAADAVIDRTIAAKARLLLLVPCCTSDAMPSAVNAGQKADTLGIPRHAPVRRRFIQVIVDTHRTWRLEAAGYETEVVEFVAPTVTPHNLLWRARLVSEPRRMQAAQNSLQRILDEYWTPTFSEQIQMTDQSRREGHWQDSGQPISETDPMVDLILCAGFTGRT